MIGGSLNLLNARNVIAANNDRKVHEMETMDFSAVVAKESGRHQTTPTRLFKRHHNVARPSAGGNSYRHIFWSCLGNQLAQEDDFGANIVGERRYVGWLHRKRYRRNWVIASRRLHAIERPVVGIGRRSAISKDDQLRA